MKVSVGIPLMLVVLMLTACQSKSPVKPAEPSQEWQPSPLSQEVMDKVHARLRVYERCVNDETQAHINDQGDSRRITDVILENCEDKLSAVKSVLSAEHVPEPNSEQLVRRKRSHAAQQILRWVMATQAVRSANPKP